MSALEKVAQEVDRLRGILHNKGILWEDQQGRLTALLDVQEWFAEESSARRAEEIANSPEVKHQDTRNLFASYREHIKGKK